MAKVLIGIPNYARYCKAGYRLLQDAGCELVENDLGRPYTAEELAVVAADVDGVIANTEPWNEETLSAAPSLKVIVRFGAGYDKVDLEAAKRHGVQVANTPGLNASAVAEHVAALILCQLRDLIPLNRSTREGKWTRMVYRDLSSCTLGLVGFGAIGQQVAKKLSGFGARILVNVRHPDPALAKELGVEFVALDELLARSDIVSLHLPHTKESYHMFNREILGKMKDGAYLINTARGPIVDESAVLEALSSGKLAGFATDVYEKEPVDPENPLLSCEKVNVTPHLAGESLSSYHLIGLATATGVLNVLNSEPLDHRLA